MVNPEFWWESDNENPTIELVEERMAQLATITENTLVIVYHSGHGVLIDGSTGLATPKVKDGTKCIVYPL